MSGTPATGFADVQLCKSSSLKVNRFPEATMRRLIYGSVWGRHRIVHKRLQHVDARRAHQHTGSIGGARHHHHARER